MMKNVLTTADLLDFNGEPRLLDLQLAKALGFERPRAIRQLIERNKTELEALGLIATRRGAYRGKPFTEYFLTMEQGLLMAVLSNAPRAAEVRRMLIRVFVAWYRGELPPRQARDEDASSALFKHVRSLRNKAAHWDRIAAQATAKAQEYR
ncbi:hypothetical protein GJU94_08140 [Brucella sp. 10RB9214]|uniref:hypothetical protein n=1 Tax=unclassified Brucella TaxID=2632610 RepID=UPI000972870E|nr:MULTISPECIES: hypothetical protein [unclassified Brucella]APY13173.1 hypothetical protein BKD02_01630 [Brucella sp. 09RB8910]MRN46135.1 hypothetical protein [Brucella sp. 10RB9212]MRN49802.1 hypothetical protein [Brucella sp. 10RB9214]